MNFWEFLTANGYVFEIILACLPLLPIIKLRNGCLLELIPSLIFLIVFSVLIREPLTEGNLFLNSLYYFIIFACLTFIVHICSEDGWVNAFYVSCCALVFQHLNYVLVRTFKVLFVILNIDGFVLDFISYLIITVATYVTLYYLFVKKIKDTENVNVSKLKSRVVFIFAFLFTVTANTYFQRLFIGLGEEYGLYNAVYGLIEIIACLSFVFILYYIKREEKLKADLKILKSLRESDKRQHEVFKQSLELLNIKYHDLKYSVNSDSAKLNDSAWVEETKKALNVCGAIQKTGNDTLDVIFVEKRFQCDALEIEFDATNVNGSLLSEMEEVDIYAIFGNALDNAIECLRNVPKGNRKLKASINLVNGMIKIQIENYSPRSINIGDGFPESTKKIKGTHGFGVKSISRTVKKYNGILHYSTEDDLFVMVIVIPYNKNSENPMQANV